MAMLIFVIWIVRLTKLPLSRKPPGASRIPRLSTYLPGCTETFPSTGPSPVRQARGASAPSSGSPSPGRRGCGGRERAQHCDRDGSPERHGQSLWQGDRATHAAGLIETGQSRAKVSLLVDAAAPMARRASTAEFVGGAAVATRHSPRCPSRVNAFVSTSATALLISEKGATRPTLTAHRSATPIGHDR